jgi:hypothetical protein
MIYLLNRDLISRVESLSVDMDSLRHSDFQLHNAGTSKSFTYTAILLPIIIKFKLVTINNKVELVL